MTTTLETGARSEAMVLAKMLQAGYRVLVPYNVVRYDLAFDAGGQLQRVQVKTARFMHGSLVFNPYSVINGTRRYYTVEEVDLYGVYSPDFDRCYLVPLSEGERATSLRVHAPKNGQAKNIRWAKDYEIQPFMLL